MIPARQSPFALTLAIWMTQFLTLIVSSAASSDWQAPLSGSEITIALGAVEQSSPLNSNRMQAAVDKSVVVGNTLIPSADSALQTLQNRQVLLIELREMKSVSGQSLPRVAEVFVFHYDQATTFKHLVEVSSGQVIESKPVGSVHLPLNPAEQEFAVQLLMADLTIADKLATEFERQFGKTMPPIHNLKNKVSIWQPLRANSEAARTCKRQRCALISVFTVNNYNFSVEPVINLHTGEVATGVLQ